MKKRLEVGNNISELLQKTGILAPLAALEDMAKIERVLLIRALPPHIIKYAAKVQIQIMDGIKVNQRKTVIALMTQCNLNQTMDLETVVNRANGTFEKFLIAQLSTRYKVTVDKSNLRIYINKILGE